MTRESRPLSAEYEASFILFSRAHMKRAVAEANIHEITDRLLRIFLDAVMKRKFSL